MNKYYDWLKAGLRKLSEDFSSGNFSPRNESDIKCHLYHSLLLAKADFQRLTPRHVVLSEFSIYDSQKKIDLAIAKKKKEGYEPRLLIEIKETSKDHLPASDIKNRVEKDIVKLRRYKKEVQNRDTRIIKNYRKPVIFFFFRGASRHGIGLETDPILKQLKNRYDDVILEWGPR